MFKLEEDNSKHGDDPHKVFSVVSGEPCPMEGLCWVQWAISGPPILGALLSANLHHSKEGDSSIPNPVVDQQAAQQQLQVAGWAQQARGLPVATPQALLPSRSPAPGQNVGWGRLRALATTAVRSHSPSLSSWSSTPKKWPQQLLSQVSTSPTFFCGGGGHPLGSAGANFVAVRHPTLCFPLGSTDSTQLKILEELLQQCDISPDLGSLDPSWVPAGETSSAHGVQGW